MPDPVVHLGYGLVVAGAFILTRVPPDVCRARRHASVNGSTFVEDRDSNRLWTCGWCDDPVPRPADGGVFRNIRGVRKWAVVFPADQTITYLCRNGETTRHPEADLYDTPEEALEALFDYYPSPLEPFGWLEQVEDESEFRSREDTW